MRQVRITEPAQEDLRAIWEYVARRQVEAANKLIKEIVKKFSTLRDHPHIALGKVDCGKLEPVILRLRFRRSKSEPAIEQ